jgi:hypothetical protein
MASLIQTVGDYMTVNEVRDRLGLTQIEEDEVGEAYTTPAEALAEEQQAEEEGGTPDGGGGGLFSGRRSLAVPDSAIPIGSRSEAPEGAQIVTGDRGGLYYIPVGEGEGGDEGQTETEQQVDEILKSEQADWKKGEELKDLTEEATGLNVRYDDFSPEQAADATRSFSALSDAGETDGLNGITSGLSEGTKSGSPNAALAYKPQTKSIEIKPEYFNEKQAQEWEDGGHLAGGSIEHLVSHEVGHHQHFEAHRNGDIDLADIQEYEFTPQERNMVETELSDYAATSPLEFVAESYGVKATGGELSGPLQDLYDELGGTEPV